MRCLIPFALLLVFTQGAIAQRGWVDRAPSVAPSARYSSASAYDSHRGRVVLFGGADLSGANLDDTWEFDGSTWVQRFPARRPPRRLGHAMTFDASRGRVVLFGGVHDEAAHSYFDDTWLWDGNDWTQAPSPQSPSPRRLARIAYDSLRRHVVLFSGKIGFANWDAETWIWSGTWQRVFPSTSPMPRDGHSLTYDSLRDRMVMFGGWVFSGPASDTWLWDGSQWSQAQPAQRPPDRVHHSADYDSSTGTVVLHGGSGTPRVLNDSWSWDGATWSPITTSRTPPPSASAAMAFDHARKRFVLHSYDVYAPPAPAPSQTWELFNLYRRFGTGCGRSGGVPELGCLMPARIGQPFSLLLSNLPQQSRTALFTGLSSSSWLSIPLPLALDGLGMPGCTLYQSLDFGVTLKTGNGTVIWGLIVPADPLLVGAEFFNQALVLDPGANPAGVVVTNGGHGVVD